VVAAEPRWATAQFVLGGLYLQKGDVRPAIDALKTATQLDPTSAAAHVALGMAHSENGDTAAALTSYKRAIALRTKDPAPYNNAAWLHMLQGKNLDEALALAQRAHELAPENGGVLDTLGFAHYRRGEYQKAEPFLKKAAEKMATNATVLYHLGLTYYKLGRTEDAAFALKRSLQLQESLPQAPEIRAMLTELKK
jgi:Flp pilus assembly protein TadD